MIKIEQALSFTWYKSPIGYQWEDAEPCDVWGEPIRKWEEDRKKNFETLIQPIPKEPFLVEINPRFQPFPWEPLTNPLLFAQFADLQPNKESFCQWANAHGRLVDIEADHKNHFFIFPRYLPFDEADVDFQRKKGVGIIEKNDCYYRRTKTDPLFFWMSEYRDLSFAVMLWELALARDSRLNGVLEWNSETERIYVNRIWKEKLDEIDFERFGRDVTYNLICGAGRDKINDLNPTLIRKGDSFDTEKAALIYVHQEIARKLRQYPLNVSLRLNKDGGLLKVIEPSNLLSAMWYQFYLVQTGEICLRRCSLCRQWENMEGHRSTWSKHTNCANYSRVKRARNKKRGKIE